jgi:hypothetical protein
MPLKMRGVISYLPMRKPTNAKIENSPRLIMTSDIPWDPHSQDFAKAEQLAVRQACALTFMPTHKQSILHNKLERAQYFNKSRNIADPVRAPSPKISNLQK